MCIAATINHIFISFSAVQIYEISYIHLNTSPSTGILRARKVASLIAQLVKHCMGIAEVMGSNPVQANSFLGFDFTTS